MSITKKLLIVGPCAAESNAQMTTIARALSDVLQGVSAQFEPVLRAGLWKPRSQPSSFQGVGADAFTIATRRSLLGFIVVAPSVNRMDEFIQTFFTAYADLKANLHKRRQFDACYARRLPFSLDDSIDFGVIRRHKRVFFREFHLF